MAIEYNFTPDSKWFFNTDKKLIFHIFKKDGVTPQDVAGWALSWMVKRRFSDTDVNALMTRTTNNGGLVITGSYNIDPDVNTQVVEAAITDELLALVSPTAKHWHELKRVDPGLEEVLTYGSLQLRQAVHLT